MDYRFPFKGSWLLVMVRYLINYPININTKYFKLICARERVFDWYNLDAASPKAHEKLKNELYGLDWINRFLNIIWYVTQEKYLKLEIKWILFIWFFSEEEIADRPLLLKTRYLFELFGSLFLYWFVERFLVGIRYNYLLINNFNVLIGGLRA